MIKPYGRLTAQKLNIRVQVLNDIPKERERQERLHPQILDLPMMFVVLNEEVGEVAEALQAQYDLPGTKRSDKQNLYQELIEVAAVATRMAERVLEYEQNNTSN